MSIKEVYPLEITDPQTFGDLDSNQIELIMPKPRGLEAYDLVLIENASQIFSNIFMAKNVFEKVLKAIIQNSRSSDCSYISSLSVPYYISSKIFKKYSGKSPIDVKDSDMTPIAKSNYERVVKNYKTKISKTLETKKCIVTILSLDFGEQGGHYAAYIYNVSEDNKKKLLVFDSMSKVNSPSVYAPFFIQLGQDIFGVDADVLVPCVQNIISLQYTGGFLTNEPYNIEKAFDKGLIDEETAHKLSVQSTDSQNHFCWLWSMWFIHLHLNGITLSEAMAQMNKNNLNPLVVIKRYGWNLIHLLNFKIVCQEFFNEYFAKIWLNPTPLSLDFTVFKIPFTSPKNFYDALLNSISPCALVPVNKTPVPKPLEKAIKIALE